MDNLSTGVIYLLVPVLIPIFLLCMIQMIGASIYLVSRGVSEPIKFGSGLILITLATLSFVLPLEEYRIFLYVFIVLPTITGYLLWAWKSRVQFFQKFFKALMIVLVLDVLTCLATLILSLQYIYS